MLRSFQKIFDNYITTKMFLFLYFLQKSLHTLNLNTKTNACTKKNSTLQTSNFVNKSQGNKKMQNKLHIAQIIFQTLKQAGLLLSKFANKHFTLKLNVNN